MDSDEEGKLITQTYVDSAFECHTFLVMTQSQWCLVPARRKGQLYGDICKEFSHRVICGADAFVIERVTRFVLP